MRTDFLLMGKTRLNWKAERRMGVSDCSEIGAFTLPLTFLESNGSWIHRDDRHGNIEVNGADDVSKASVGTICCVY